MGVHDIIYGIRTFSKRSEGDSVDSLNYFVTTNLLVVFSGLSAYKAYAGDPLDCLLPTRFSSSWQSVFILTSPIRGSLEGYSIKNMGKYWMPDSQIFYSLRSSHIFGSKAAYFARFPPKFRSNIGSPRVKES